MAGSFQHVATLGDDGKLRLRLDLIENMSDAGQAITEMFDIIEHLSSSDQFKLFQAHRAHCLKRYGFFEEELWKAEDYLRPDNEDDGS